jgi:hypothetical protein
MIRSERLLMQGERSPAIKAASYSFTGVTARYVKEIVSETMTPIPRKDRFQPVWAQLLTRAAFISRRVSKLESIDCEIL